MIKPLSNWGFLLSGDCWFHDEACMLETDRDLVKSPITDITMDRPARKLAPIRKLPVRSLMAPAMNGPANPPISAAQKNIPVADPMCLEPTSGVSINMSVRRG